MMIFHTMMTIITCRPEEHTVETVQSCIFNNMAYLGMVNRRDLTKVRFVAVVALTLEP